MWINTKYNIFLDLLLCWTCSYCCKKHKSGRGPYRNHGKLAKNAGTALGEKSAKPGYWARHSPPARRSAAGAFARSIGRGTWRSGRTWRPRPGSTWGTRSRPRTGPSSTTTGRRFRGGRCCASSRSSRGPENGGFPVGGGGRRGQHDEAAAAVPAGPRGADSGKTNAKAVSIRFYST